MIRVSELTGAQLDYWVARAEGTPADELAVVKGPLSTKCYYTKTQPHRAIGRNLLVGFSWNWEWGGPLIEKHRIEVLANGVTWTAIIRYHRSGMAGDTPLQAICRAVVRAAFGDEVEEINITE